MKKYGYNEEIKEFLINGEKSIPKGQFLTIQRKNSNNWYWYFNKSKGNNKMIYLCSVENKGKSSTSFLNAVEILKKKVKVNTVSNARLNYLHQVVDIYILNLREEGNSFIRGNERTKQTTSNITYYLKKFRLFCKENRVTLLHTTQEEFRKTFSTYISILINNKYSPNAIKGNLTYTRQFLDTISNPIRGEKYIHKHYISKEYISSEFSASRFTVYKKSTYKPENYAYIFELCNKKARSIWREYIRTNRKPRKHTLIYFSSLLQLNYGFRIREILNCYNNYEIMKRNYDGKSGFSYLEPSLYSPNTFNIVIYSKKKHGNVYVDYDIISWDKPASSIPYTEGIIEKNGINIPAYYTNILDVISFLYSNNKHLFSTHITTVFSDFRKEFVDKHNLMTKGVETSHNLRDMCINYYLHTKKETLLDVAELTRHNVSTLEKYYLHHSREISKDKSIKLETRSRLEDLRKL